MSEGTIAWLLVSSALVLFMTPGLALFYGGMVRSKNVLNMLMKNFFTISIVTVVWTVIGYTLAFGTDLGGIIGGLDFLGLKGMEGDALLFMVFQMMFAIITPALISGAVAERMKFSAWVLFTTLWALIVYPIVAHWGFAADGWLFAWGVRDFAGGLVVHINAGIAALALVFALGPRRGFGAEAMRPHSLPLTLLGTGILWFGWFGFNAGSALAADGIAINAFVTTQIAASVAALGWVVAEWIKSGKPTTLGAASGAVAGLVAITPGAGFVSPLSAIAIGLIAGFVCFWAVSLKFRFGYDDSLDVVGVHLAGGIVGSVLLGVFAQSSINEFVPDGLLFGGAGFFLKQVVAVLAVMTFTFVASYLLARIVKAITGLRVDENQETEGLDISLHEERGYVLSE
ncbi:MAG TPA: ammonium transporter [Acidimicrobiia bacterium]|jgi:Amt family ammonium transporter|nr:ammonium transporter [Acidimicrobiia bacterium]